MVLGKLFSVITAEISLVILQLEVKPVSPKGNPPCCQLYQRQHSPRPGVRTRPCLLALDDLHHDIPLLSANFTPLLSNKWEEQLCLFFLLEENHEDE